MGLQLTIYLLAGIVAGTIAGLIAPRKRRHAGFWTTAAFIFPPALLVLLFMSTSAREAPRPRSTPEWEDDLDRL
jgi:hypothetical protein